MAMRIVPNLKLDKDGYGNGKVTVTRTSKTVNQSANEKHSIMIDTKEIDCYELIFNCETTKNNPLTIKTAIFGTSINPEPNEEKRIGKKMVKIYNKLTTTLIGLGLITPDIILKARQDDSILDTEKIEADFLAIKDLPVKFKARKNAKGFNEVNLLTLEIVSK